MGVNASYELNSKISRVSDVIIFSVLKRSFPEFLYIIVSKVEALTL
jgi:hypothetical protein